MSNVINWRPYQVACKKAIKDSFDKGINKQLIVQATGLGKRLQAIDLMQHFNRTLFIAHREELIMQAYDDIIRFFPMQCGIIKAQRFELDKRIVVASVQTLHRRLDKIDPNTFDLVIVDECHHYQAKTYVTSVRHFTPRLLTGWTATPNRMDGLNLTNLFQEVVFTHSIGQGIQEGYLAKLDAYKVQTHGDLSHIKKVAGDFNQKQLSDAVDTELRNNLIVHKYKEYAEGRQAIAFCVDMDHAYHLKRHFLDYGITAEAVVSDTTRCPNRSEILERFSRGEIQVICNVMILCLDLQTEILTTRGWLKHHQMTPDDLVANYNLDGSIFFRKPEKIVKRKLYDFEKMVTVKTKQSDIRVTNTHRMIYKTGTNGKWNKDSAESLIGKRWSYPSCGEADSLKFNLEQPFEISTAKRKRLVTASVYNLINKNGYSRTEARIEAEKRVSEKLSLRYKNPHELSLNDCRLIGFWLGDGSVNQFSEKGFNYTLCQSLHYPKIIQYVDNLLDELNLAYIKRKKQGQDNPYYVWEIPKGTGSGSQKRNGLFYLEPYLKKDGTKLFWGLNKLQIEALIEGLWYADGYHKQADSVPSTKFIGSTFHELLSMLQAVLVCRGFKANINLLKSNDDKPNHKPLYMLTVENRKTQSVASTKEAFQAKYDEIINPEEEVWCVKTTSRNIITRRNGRVCIMGNTEGFDYSDVGCVLMARPTQSETVYVQAVGRGARLKSQAFKDKFEAENCIILDFVDNTGRHSLVNAHELEKNKPIEERVMLPAEHREKLLEERQKREAKIHSRIQHDAQVDLLEIPEFKMGRWREEKMIEAATEAQVNFIKKLGVYTEGAEYTKFQASELISNQPADKWQLNYLAANKYDISQGATIGQYQKVKQSLEGKAKKKKRTTIDPGQLQEAIDRLKKK